MVNERGKRPPLGRPNNSRSKKGAKGPHKRGAKGPVPECGPIEPLLVDPIQPSKWSNYLGRDDDPWVKNRKEVKP